jgi:Calcineurin-like phosphoesterase
MAKLRTYVVAHDLHYPEYSKKTWDAMMEFIKDVKPQGFIFGGDQFDNNEISHHTKGKPFYRPRASFQRNTTGFSREILGPLEKSLGNAEKVWIVGNHDRFEHDLIEEQPELEGIIERVDALGLGERGWTIVPLGHSHRLGELNVIHGEILTGIGNQAGAFPAKKAIEIYAGNVLAGHTHAPQSFSKISPVEVKKKYMAWIAPILGATNPAYLRNRPTSWLNGFTVVELREKGLFNLFPVVVIDGEFSYGGKFYKG